LVQFRGRAAAVAAIAAARSLDLHDGPDATAIAMPRGPRSPQFLEIAGPKRPDGDRSASVLPTVCRSPVEIQTLGDTAQRGRPGVRELSGHTSPEQLPR